MSERLLERTICEKCGTSVRDGSAFCYNCGESVLAVAPPPPIGRPAGALNGNSRSAAKTAVFGDQELPPAPVAPSEPLIADPPRDPKLRSAASMRGAARARLKTQSEIAWVERRSSAGMFIVASIIFAMIGAFLLIGALYLR